MVRDPHVSAPHLAARRIDHVRSIGEIRGQIRSAKYQFQRTAGWSAGHVSFSASQSDQSYGGNRSHRHRRTASARSRWRRPAPTTAAAANRSWITGIRGQAKWSDSAFAAKTAGEPQDQGDRRVRRVDPACRSLSKAAKPAFMKTLYSSISSKLRLALRANQQVFFQPAELRLADSSERIFLQKFFGGVNENRGPSIRRHAFLHGSASCRCGRTKPARLEPDRTGRRLTTEACQPGTERKRRAKSALCSLVGRGRRFSQTNCV